MLRKTLLTAILLMPVTSMAALPPYWDSVRQLESLLHGDFAYQTDGPVVEIKRIGELTFTVNTKYCQRTVELQAHWPDDPLAVGAASYTVKKVSGTCK